MKRHIHCQWKRIIHQHHKKMNTTTTTRGLKHKFFCSEKSIIERGLVALGSSVVAMRNPERGDMVAAVGETLPWTIEVVEKIWIPQMKATEAGRKLLKEKPTITMAQVERMKDYEKDTLGYAYYRFIKGIDREEGKDPYNPEKRTPVRYMTDDPEMTYCMWRYRQIHDLAHVLSGYEATTVQNELAIKVFEAVHYKLPMPAMASMASIPLLFLTNKHLQGDNPSAQRAFFVNHQLPWAIQAGKQSDFLLAQPFEDLFQEKIQHVREMLHLCQGPQPQ